MMKYCKKCVYPESAAITLTFDDKEVCSACKVHNQKDSINWEERFEKIKKLAEQYRSKDGSNYDCIIPVSGGKDSWFQTFFVTQILKLNPLLVTYNGNNYLPQGLKNLKKMRKVFKCDHIFFSPNTTVLKKLNRWAMRRMGDMNWHAHCGICTYPYQVAVEKNIPLIVWGEHGRTDMGGMYSMNDFIEYTYKQRHEHECRGYEWDDIVNDKEYGEGLTKQDLLWTIFPKEEDIERVGARGIYLFNYVKWDATWQTEFVKTLGFEENPTYFERTYRKFSNLDDIHENGMHDYLKYIKFGYGRASDHASKDIRLGYITRDEGIALVKRFDSVKSSDLKRWLRYVGWTEEEFDKVCDGFRDKRVWKKENNKWVKDNLWDGMSKEKLAEIDKIIGKVDDAMKRGNDIYSVLSGGNKRLISNFKEPFWMKYFERT